MTLLTSGKTAGSLHGSASAAHRPPSGFRPEVQGLRAVAVLLVVGYHLYPNRLSGGYVGVDVFFVISGYLITSHLYREAASTGRLSLAGFWARRIRRLLPASLLVLAASALITVTVIPATLWDQTVRQLIASTLYVQNWALAGDAVDYSAGGNVPTVVQHYWSLSVEEQFYLIWPVLVAVVLLGCRGRRRHLLPLALTSALALLAVASLAYSAWLTSRSPGEAYFVSPTRIWEFAAGALLALSAGVAARQVSWPAPTRALLGWSGIAAIVWSGFSYDAETPFPGLAALVPVLGTVAVIAAGAGISVFTAGHWLSLRPATFVGDISYSVYLWHWPVIVAVPYLTGVDLRTTDKAVILAATLLLAWASTRWVETPLRGADVLASAPWRSFVAALLGMSLLIGAAELVRQDLDSQVAHGRERIASVLAEMETTGCLGPAALDPRNRCTSPTGDGPLVTPPEVVARQNTDLAYPDCQSDLDSAVLRTCDVGQSADPQRTVAIVGDSHATHWFPALDQIGKRAGWKVVTFTKSSCPFTLARRTLPEETDPSLRERCERFNDEVLRRLVNRKDIDTVFVSAFSSAYDWVQRPGHRVADPATDGFRLLWRRLVTANKQVVVLHDVPRVKDQVNTPDCLAEHDNDPQACATTRSEGLVADVEAEAARRGAPRGVRLLDLTDLICDQRSCYPVVGDVIVYRDYSHLSAEYATLLAPYLLRRFNQVDRSP